MQSKGMYIEDFHMGNLGLSIKYEMGFIRDRLHHWAVQHFRNEALFVSYTSSSIHNYLISTSWTPQIISTQPQPGGCQSSVVVFVIGNRKTM